MLFIFISCNFVMMTMLMMIICEHPHAHTKKMWTVDRYTRSQRLLYYYIYENSSPIQIPCPFYPFLVLFVHKHKLSITLLPVLVRSLFVYRCLNSKATVAYSNISFHTLYIQHTLCIIFSIPSAFGFVVLFGFDLIFTDLPSTILCVHAYSHILSLRLLSYLPTSFVCCLLLSAVVRICFQHLFVYLNWYKWLYSMRSSNLEPFSISIWCLFGNDTFGSGSWCLCCNCYGERERGRKRERERNTYKKQKLKPLLAIREKSRFWHDIVAHMYGYTVHTLQHSWIIAQNLYWV